MVAVTLSALQSTYATFRGTDPRATPPKTLQCSAWPQGLAGTVTETSTGFEEKQESTAGQRDEAPPSPRHRLRDQNHHVKPQRQTQRPCKGSFCYLTASAYDAGMNHRLRPLIVILCITLALTASYGTWRWAYATEIEMARIERSLIRSGFFGPNYRIQFNADGTYSRMGGGGSDTDIQEAHISQGTWQVMESGSIIVLTMSNDGRTSTRRVGIDLEGFPCADGLHSCE